jgi:hypothetical protein
MDAVPATQQTIVSAALNAIAIHSPGLAEIDNCLVTCNRTTEPRSPWTMKRPRLIRVLAALGWLVCCSAWRAPSQSFTWDPSLSTDVAGYVLYYGNASGAYDHRLDVGLNTSTNLSDLVPGLTYFVVVSAYDAAGDESNPSNELSFIAPTPVPLSIELASPNGIRLSWTAVAGQTYRVQYSSNLLQSSWTDLGTPITATNSFVYVTEDIIGVTQRFYRVMPAP